MVANGDLSLSLPPGTGPWAVTADNKGLQILLGDAVAVQGIAIIEQESVDN